MTHNKPHDWRARLHEFIFEADTRSGKVFDIILMTSILCSVLVVMLDSVDAYQAKYGALFYQLEWFFTALFTVEYMLRIVSVKKPGGYIFSFFGLVDLFSILPTYVSLLLPGTQYFLVIRILRVLRIFRVLKFTQYLLEVEQLRQAIRASRRKITVFIFTVIAVTVIVGSLMYLVEGPEHGFTSIPRSIYWAVVTLTTVGYGDISPETPLGQMFAVFIMICGYGIIAVPTGIVSAELSKTSILAKSTQVCRSCSHEDHDFDAQFCKYCGEELNS